MDAHEHVQLGPYTLKERLGAGGMAEVWLAERTMMGAHKTVAIKLLNAVARESQEQREMFLDEARLSMALNHSSIVQVFDVAEHAGECFITMEWVDGLNLAELTALMWERGESMPLPVSAYIVGEVLRALAHAHNVESRGSTGIVHRDISPQNVMLSVGGEVKIMDFGVARFATEHTTGKFLKGKVRYMPPEQAKLQSRDPNIDLFAVGAIFYELIEDQRFRAGTVNEIELLRMAMNGVVPALTRREGLPAKIKTLVEGLLETNPALRLANARGALRMLSEWQGYRNAAFELEAIVARHRTAHADYRAEAGTSISAARQIQARMDSHLASESQTAPAGTDTGAWRGVNAPTDTTLEQLDGESVDDTSVGSIWSRRTTRATRGAALAVALLALGLGSTTLWFGVRGLASGPGSVDQAGNSNLAHNASPAPTAEAHAEAEALPLPAAPSAPPEPAAPPSASPAKPQQPTPPSPASRSDDEGDALELELELDDDPSESSPADEPGPRGASAELPPESDEPQSPEAPKPAKTAKQKVKVTFAAAALRRATIKVGRREFDLSPSKTVALPEGRYTVKLLDRSTNDWIKAGRVHLEPGHDYEVRMLEPSGIQTIESD